MEGLLYTLRADVYAASVLNGIIDRTLQCLLPSGCLWAAHPRPGSQHSCSRVCNCSEPVTIALPAAGRRIWSSVAKLSYAGSTTLPQTHMRCLPDCILPTTSTPLSMLPVVSSQAACGFHAGRCCMAALLQIPARICAWCTRPTRCLLLPSR